jgi:hypothetical protein
MTTRSAPAPIFEDIATATPAEIDEQLARLGAESAQIDHGLVSLRREQGRAQEVADGYGPRMGVRKPRPLAEIAELIEQAEQCLTEIRHHFVSLNSEYIRRGTWRRYYLVEDGHLHYDVSGSRCSRIYSTTHYWMTEFSGQDPAEVIALAGERVCTTCFPEAPVAPRPASARFMTLTEAERAAHAEAKARKQAAKKAAQITNPDGSELRTADGVHGDLIKTEVAARRRALADASDIAFYGESHPQAPEWRETVRRMIEAIAHRDAEYFGGTGVTVDSLRDEINAKVAKKAKREQWAVKATV